MNPRALKNFLTSKFGLFVIFMVVVFGGLWIYGHRQIEQKKTAQLSVERGKKPELGHMKMPLNEGLENGIPQQTEHKEQQKKDPASAGQIVPFQPPAGETADAKGAVKDRKVYFPSLLASYDPPPATPQVDPPAKRFIPFGTLLKCKLVNTVDSSNLGTPVIAILLEDVWQDKELVIPANTLVHGMASAGRIRDRINASGTWRFVWQDGRELAFNGIALDREYDHEIDGYGITDGSAGLKGEVMQTDDFQELKLLAAAAMSGFARGTETQTQTVLGTTITGSVENGAREGVGEVFDMYAKRTLSDIEQNGYYVRVAAGKEFYVYVTQTVDPDKAKMAGSKIEQPEKLSESDPAPAPTGSEFSDAGTKMKGW